MAKIHSGFSEKFIAKPSANGSEPRSVRNEILLSLPAKECADLARRAGIRARCAPTTC